MYHTIEEQFIKPKHTLTNAEQAEIIRKVRAYLVLCQKDNKDMGFCEAVKSVTQNEYSLEDITHLTKYKPTIGWGSGLNFWFNPCNQTPRLAICDKALADLEGDDIKAFAEKHPEAKEALAKVYPDKFDNHFDLSKLRLRENWNMVFERDKCLRAGFNDDDPMLIMNNGEFQNKAFRLDREFINWELRTEDNYCLLIPTKK